jgi:hypothetical protein
MTRDPRRRRHGSRDRGTHLRHRTALRERLGQASRDRVVQGLRAGRRYTCDQISGAGPMWGWRAQISGQTVTYDFVEALGYPFLGILILRYATSPDIGNFARRLRAGSGQ